MDYKQKIDYLSRYQNCMQKIVGLDHERVRWESVKNSLAHGCDVCGVKGSNKTSRQETAVVRIVDIIAQIDVETEKAMRLRDDIRVAIKEHSKRLRYAEILELYYIHGVSKRTLATRWGKDIKTIHNALSRAIHELDI